MNFEILEIKKLNTQIEKLMNKELMPLGLTYSQSTIMAYLYESKGIEIHQRDIEKILGLSHPTVSGILKRMEKEKLVKIRQNKKDKRFNTIELEEISTTLFTKINDSYSKVKEILFSNLSKEEKDVFNEYIAKLLKDIE